MGDRSSDPPRRYSICNRERAPMRRGRFGSARYGGPCAAGPDETNAALSHGRTQSGAGRRPRFVSYRQESEILQSRFVLDRGSSIRNKFPHLGDVTKSRVDHSAACVTWTSGPQRRTGSADVKGGSEEPPFLLVRPAPKLGGCRERSAA